VRNPASGSGAAGEAAQRLRALGAEVREFGIDEVDEAVTAGPDRVVVAGGDGSLAPVAAAAGNAQVALAVIPAGTANDFADRLGLPTDLGDAATLAVRGERTKRLDLGRMDGRPFVNVASTGLAPVAARNAGALKGALGPFAYLAGAVRAGLSAEPVRCSVTCDGPEVFSGDAWQATVACSGAFGAGSRVEADPADARLDASVIEAGPRWALLRAAYGMRRGRLAPQPGVHTARGRAIEVMGEGELSFNVDGEVTTARSPQFRVDPQAFEVVVP
jgi:YegS/Rv2252/BmrU family lipid kinase